MVTVSPDLVQLPTRTPLKMWFAENVISVEIVAGIETETLSFQLPNISPSFAPQPHIPIAPAAIRTQPTNLMITS